LPETGKIWQKIWQNPAKKDMRCSEILIKYSQNVLFCFATFLPETGKKVAKNLAKSGKIYQKFVLINILEYKFLLLSRQ